MATDLESEILTAYPEEPACDEPACEELATGEPALHTRISQRWILGPGHLAMVVVFGALFVFMNHLPLRATDLWIHANYGNWILQHGRLPTEDPVLPLAEGMKVVDNAWLSQVGFALVDRYAGPEWLSHLFALTTLITFVLLARTFYLQSGRRLVAMIGVGAVIFVGWSRLTTVRPESLAALCFACLLWLIVGSLRRRADTERPARNVWKRQPRGWPLWLGVPLLMALWANLHGSFVCGLAVLGCCFVGRLVEVAYLSRSLAGIINDRSLRRWFVLCELGVLATLLNPYGVDLLLQTLWFASNENLRSVLEWQPLVILGVGGREFALSWVVLLFVMRHSRRPVPVAHVLLLGLFGVAVISGVRMLTWFAPIYGFVLVPQAADLVARWLPAAQPAQPMDIGMEEGQVRPGRAFAFSLACLLVIWIAFAVSPLSTLVLGGKRRTPQQLLGSSTPLALTEYLRQQPPQGQLYNPQWWGDWLVHDGPPGLKPFVTTSIHLTPRQVWHDYQRVARAQSGWQEVFDRYRVTTVILDKNQQRPQTLILRQNRDWRIVYEDPQALVFARHTTQRTGVRQDDGKALPKQSPAAAQPPGVAASDGNINSRHNLQPRGDS